VGVDGATLQYVDKLTKAKPKALTIINTHAVKH